MQDNRKNIKRREIIAPASSGGPLRRRKFLTKVGAATMVGQASVQSVSANDGKKETYTLESFDGTKLIARLYTPSNPSRSDYVIPYSWGLSKSEVRKLAKDLFRQNNTVIQYDQRGYGESRGKQSHNRQNRIGIKDLQAVVQFFVEEEKIEQNPTLKVFK